MAGTDFEAVVREWAVLRNGRSIIPRDQLFEVFQQLMGETFSKADIELVVSEIGDGEDLVPVDCLINWFDCDEEEEEYTPLGFEVASPKLQSMASQIQDLASQLDRLNHEMSEQQDKVSCLSASIKRQFTQFSMGQYNILAGYLGNNMEPWFLYGVDMTPERRREIHAKFSERGPDGRHCNVGWPNYVHGILSEAEQRQVEAIHVTHFAWEERAPKLIEEIRKLDADVLSLVECDHYEDLFQPELAKLGYDSIWKQRPRPSSQDGCCIAWRQGVFELVGHDSIEYVDRYDPALQQSFKDRVALMALLKYSLTGQKVFLVSTHLARNPELAAVDMLRARQIGQVVRALATLAAYHDAMDAPVLLTGDLNATSFGKLRGMASALALLREDTLVHPFTFDCKDVPTGVTSVTCSRNMRIDAVLYQSQRLELIDMGRVPKLSEAIPNKDHPSDHLPLRATFRLKTRWQMTQHYALEWYLGVTCRPATMILTREQLMEAFDLYDKNCNGVIAPEELRWSLQEVLASAHLGVDPCSHLEVDSVMRHFQSTEITAEAFCRVYTETRAQAGLPWLNEFLDAFKAFNKDGNGRLSVDETLVVFRETSPVAVPETEVREIFEKIDRNGDGVIDEKEFVSFLTSVWMSKFV